MASMSSDRLASTPRLLATAVGVAITGMSAAQLAQADQTEPLSLGTTTVTGDAVEGDYKVEQAQSSKYTAPLRDTPRSVTVITEQVIQDTGALSLTDALRTSSGITFGAGEGGNPAGDRPIIRGFNAESDVFIDGLRDVGSQTREIFNIEGVEVSKGPGSAYTGAGSTGGSLNLITKTAKRHDFLDGSFTYGSDQTRRYTLDVNRVLTDNVAGRLNLMKHEANVAGRDGVEVSRWGVAPTVTFGFDTPTRLTLSYYHLETDDVPDYGLPLTESSNAVRRPVSVDRSNFYGLTERDYRETTSDSGTVRIEHDLNEAITVSNTFRMVRTTFDSITTNPDDSAGNISEGLVWRSAKSRNAVNEGWVNQTDLRAVFETGTIEHTLVTGIEASDNDVHNRGYSLDSGGRTCTAVGPNCADLYNPAYDTAWSGSITDSQNYTDTDTQTLSAYVFDTLKFNEQWSLNMGLRYDDFDTTSSGYGSLAGRGSAAGDFERESNSHFWNYQLGLVFNPLPNGSVYAAWSTSSNPVGETSGEGLSDVAYNTLDLEPERNRNYEIGTKWDFFNNRLGLNAAIFRTEKTNMRVTDADGATIGNIGETKVDGFEVGATGQLTSKWQVLANYTYLDGEIVDGGVVSGVAGANDGNDIPNTAENSLSLWTTYEVLPKVTIGGGAFYVDSRFGNEANTVEVPSYWRYDAMASYRVNEHVDVQLNVQNLTDKRYFDQVFTTHMAHVAAGRTVLLSTNFHY